MKKIIILLVLILGLCNGFAKSIEIVSKDVKPLHGNLFVYSTLDSLTFDQVLELPKDSFVVSDLNVPNLGVSDKTHWIKFSLLNKTAVEDFILNFALPIADRATLFYYEEKKLIQQTIGDEMPYHQRKYNDPNLLFDIKVPSGKSVDFYLKIRSGEQILVPLFVGTYKHIIESSKNNDLAYGIYFGVIVVMFLYNLFIFLSTKDVSYLYYILYILTVGMVQISFPGYTFKYFWPQNMWWAKHGLLVFGAFSGITIMLFVKDFLQVKKHASKLIYLIYFIISIYSFAFIAAITDNYNLSYKTIDLAGIILSFSTLFIAINISVKGFRPAKFFMVAWIIFLVGLFAFVFRSFGLLPYNNFTNYTMPLGSAIETVLLSFALADRINVLKREKEHSQADALQMAQENERIIREQNIMLEQKVTERTIELQQSNEELNATLENLKETQAQLVDSEKMASLGQLTAGIAHEINNPINFVTSNITPLKHDVADIMELLDKYDEIKYPDALEQKLKEIKELKEEIDLDYLKTEIESLLKGIQEGAERTSEIVRGLKNFSRLDEDDLKKASINEGIESTLTILNNKLKDNIIVNKNFTQNSDIDCYPGKINQLLMNIINNGIQAIESQKDYLPGNGVIDIKTENVGDELMISISDNGVGMDESTKKKVFDPFYTTKDVGKGTGLGMSIVYNIIQNHHGRISIDSEVGKGTTISIFLPTKAAV